MTQMTFAEACEALHDLDTHARAWTRLLLAEASRPEKSEEEMAYLANAASSLAKEASTFRALRSSAEKPDSLSDLLACVDRGLAQAYSLEEVLEAAAGRDEDRSWYDHEIRALHRLEAARAGLELPLDPASGETPAAELSLLAQHLNKLGREALIEFESRGDGGYTILASFSGRGPDMEPDLAERLLRLAPHLLEGDMPGWQNGQGSDGRLRLCGDGEPWLDAVDRNEDWLLERTIDLEALAERNWDENDAIPSP